MERSNERSTTKQKKEVEQLSKEKEDLIIRMTTLESELKVRISNIYFKSLGILLLLEIH